MVLYRQIYDLWRHTDSFSITLTQDETLRSLSGRSTIRSLGKSLASSLKSGSKVTSSSFPFADKRSETAMKSCIRSPTLKNSIIAAFAALYRWSRLIVTLQKWSVNSSSSFLAYLSLYWWTANFPNQRAITLETQKIGFEWSTPPATVSTMCS